MSLTAPAGDPEREEEPEVVRTRGAERRRGFHQLQVPARLHTGRESGKTG